MSNNQRIRLSKQLLKDSLIKLLATKSIHKLSVKQICEDAQVNRSTFYRYYGSQYDLLKDMEKDTLKQIRSYLEQETDVDDAGNIHQLTKIFIFFNENIELIRILLSNNVDPGFPQKLVLSMENIPRLLSRQVHTKFRQEEFDYLFDFMVNGGFSFIRKWINKELREAPEEVALMLNRILLKLLAPIEQCV